MYPNVFGIYHGYQSLEQADCLHFHPPSASAHKAKQSKKVAWSSGRIPSDFFDGVMPVPCKELKTKKKKW